MKLKNGREVEAGQIVLAALVAGAVHAFVGRVTSGEPDARGAILVRAEARPADGGEYCLPEQCVLLSDALNVNVLERALSHMAGELTRSTERMKDLGDALEKARKQHQEALVLIEEQTGALQSARARVAELETECAALQKKTVPAVALDFRGRVRMEAAELYAKLTALDKFLRGDLFGKLDEAEQKRMQAQALAMTDYLAVLQERIAAFPAETEVKPAGEVGPPKGGTPNPQQPEGNGPGPFEAVGMALVAGAASVTAQNAAAAAAVTAEVNG